MDDLQKLYQASSPTTTIDINSMPKLSKKLKQKQWILIAVLGITAAILIAFAALTFNGANLWFATGLLVMISSVVARIIAEILSLYHFQNIKPDLSTEAYGKLKVSYYESRIKLHNRLTPILLISYWIGFILLIPTFKEVLSGFMFGYVCISSVPLAVAMIWFIRFQIKREIERLEAWKATS